jgi:hypothetical protein
VTVAVVAGATVGLTSSASAAQECTTITVSGGNLPICKSRVWDGNGYDGKWWLIGVATLPSCGYLQGSEGGTVYNSAYSGSYNDRYAVYFRVCSSLSGGCTS